ncbi:MAG: hypothetical protein H0V43_01270, partial [Gemmatimonadales bacterium]|nr:hypothetical protein [Gemmatimonadales bacterium]
AALRVRALHVARLEFPRRYVGAHHRDRPALRRPARLDVVPAAGVSELRARGARARCGVLPAVRTRL